MTYDLIEEWLAYAQTINTEGYASASEKFEKMLESAQAFLPRKPRGEPSFTIRGGNAGMLASGKIIGDTPQSCPLNIWLRCNNIEEPKGDKTYYTFEQGFAQERVFKLLNPTFEVGVRNPNPPKIKGYPIHGEIDAKSPEGVYYELKSIQSSNKLKPFLVEGEYKFDNLLQLAFYMSVYVQNKGVLRYVSMVYHKSTINKVEWKFHPGMYRDYEVEFDSQGRFHVDGKPTIITTDSIYRFIEYIAWMYESQPRCAEILVPMSRDKLDENTSCYFCKFKEVCERARRENWTLDKFTQGGKDVVEFLQFECDKVSYQVRGDTKPDVEEPKSAGTKRGGKRNSKSDTNVRPG